jgi:hypothetical protein
VVKGTNKVTGPAGYALAALLAPAVCALAMPSDKPAKQASVAKRKHARCLSEKARECCVIGFFNLGLS